MDYRTFQVTVTVLIDSSTQGAALLEVEHRLAAKNKFDVDPNGLRIISAKVDGVRPK